MGAQHAGGPVLYQPPAPDDPAVVGGHRVAARLGVGALGPVYLAYGPGGQPVSLTVVRAELAARPGFAAAFAHDVQVVRRVHGPFTIPVLGSGTDGSRYWLAAAHVPALTLHDAVTGTGRALPVPAVLRLVAGVAEALRAVHHAGVVHGGLGPGTVLLAADGPRVTGYGVTRADADAPGIPAFTSPEQAADKPPVPATDVFALGQVAAYAAIGLRPRVLQEEPDLSELPGELREIVTRCLIKDPALRPSPAQVIAMCTQAARPAPHTPWLPAPLLTLLTTPLPEPPPIPPVPQAPQQGDRPQGAPALSGVPARHGDRPAGAAPDATPAAGTAVPLIADARPAPAVPQAPQRTGWQQGAPAAGAVAGVTPPGAPPIPDGRPDAAAALGVVRPAEAAVPPGGPASPPAQDEAAVDGVPSRAAVAGSDVAVAAPLTSGPAHSSIPGSPAAVPPQTPHVLPSAPPPAPHVLPSVPPPAPHVRPSPPPQALNVRSSPSPQPPHAQPPLAPAPAPPHGPGPHARPPVAPTHAPGGGHWYPHGWAHVPVRGKRRSGALAVVAGLVVVVAAGFGLGKGFGGGGGDAGAAAPPAAGATSPDAQAPAPQATRAYPRVELAAGDGLELGVNPPQIVAGPQSGTFAYSPAADGFTTDAGRGTFVLLDPDTPGTLTGCREGGRRTRQVTRVQVPAGSRMCVLAADGTTALVTFRQFLEPSGPPALAVFDLTVWPARQL